MTLQEAINSGKRFRRKGWTVVITADPTYWLQSGRTLHLSTADILADDWEIEEVRVTITATQFQKALDTALLSRQWIIPAPFVQDPAILHAYHRDVVAMFDDFVVKLKKELGL